MTISDTLASNFLNMMGQFLSSLNEVFPSCPHVTGYNVAFCTKTHDTKGSVATQLGTEAMTEYHEVMNPYYARCKVRDVSLLQEDISFLHRLGMTAKWGGMDQDTRDCVWEYINNLNGYCMEAWPESRPSPVNQLAQGLNGLVNTESSTQINPFEVSMKLLQNMNEQDMVELRQGLGNGNPADMVTSLFQQVTAANPSIAAVMEEANMDVGATVSNLMSGFDESNPMGGIMDVMNKLQDPSTHIVKN